MQSKQNLEKRCEDEHVQMEFPFTKKGFMQQRAIHQDSFLHSKYSNLNYIKKATNQRELSYTEFENRFAVRYMKFYAKLFPLDYERLTTLL
jgi:hypothetical protein